MTERTQVTEVVADFKMGAAGLDNAVERLAAILGLGDTDTDVIRDILIEGENDPSDAIVNEIDAEYELDSDLDFDDDEDADFEIDDAEGAEFGGEAGGA